jgi:hypothetical protein
MNRGHGEKNARRASSAVNHAKSGSARDLVVSSAVNRGASGARHDVSRAEIARHTTATGRGERKPHHAKKSMHSSRRKDRHRVARSRRSHRQ